MYVISGGNNDIDSIIQILLDLQAAEKARRNFKIYLLFITLYSICIFLNNIQAISYHGYVLAWPL